jgi:predicted phosphoribosyltransferase
MQCAIKNGYGWLDKDLEVCEENGCVEGTEPSKVSNIAKRRGSPQLGSSGSGNHSLEIKKVGKVYNEHAARVMGILGEGHGPSYNSYLAKWILITSDMYNRFGRDDDTNYTIFENREDAGRRLAERLRSLLDKNKNEDSDNRSNTQILAIPRGGVVTGDVLASILGLDLDIIVSRKIGAPDNPELAIGAVMHDGSFFANSDLIRILQISNDYIKKNIAIQMKEIQRRLLLFRHSQEYNLRGKTIILVDDGIATGASVFAAIQWIREQKPETLIVAIPVAPKDAIQKLEGEEGVNQVVFLETPEPFGAVGAFYEDFSQVSDEEVLRIMNKYRIRK